MYFNQEIDKAVTGNIYFCDLDHKFLFSLEQILTFFKKIVNYITILTKDTLPKWQKW
ncbi:hypothetical protein O1Q79_00894 [Lonepinella sp. MS14434]